MNIIKKLFGLLYKGYIMLRERFFQIPPLRTQPPQPSSIMGEGVGEADIQQEYQLVEKQQFQPSQVYTSGGGEVVEEERAVTVHPPPLTPPTRGGGTCPRVNWETFPPPVPPPAGGEGGGGGAGGGTGEDTPAHQT